MTVADLAARCLDYPNIAVADAPTVAPGAARWIRDSIYLALAEMRDTAPQLFRVEKGIALGAPIDSTVTVSTSTKDSGTFASATPLRSVYNTARIATGVCDVSILTIASAVATFTPAHTGTYDSAVAVTVWHDSVELGDTNFAKSGDFCTVDGERIFRVSGLEQAREYMGQTTEDQRTASKPRYWWTEQYRGKLYLRVYPMPDQAYAVGLEMSQAIADVAIGDIYTSTETFNLSYTHRLEIMLPLVIDHFRRSPLFNNRAAEEKVMMTAKDARERLADLQEKREALPPWNTRAVQDFDARGRFYR